MELKELIKKVFEINKANGWHEEKHETPTYLMLIVSELAEAMEADRENRHSCLNLCRKKEMLEDKDGENFKIDFRLTIKDSFEDEIADVIIRCLDLCAMMDIDIEKHILLKLKYNQLRGFRHGNKSY